VGGMGRTVRPLPAELGCAAHASSGAEGMPPGRKLLRACVCRLRARPALACAAHANYWLASKVVPAMTLWKVYAMDDDFPGLWQHWYRNQCVAIGYAPYWGAKLHGKTKDHWGGSWNRTRKQLLRVAVGDFVVAALKGNRVGRLGQVTELHVEDDEWDETVPSSKDSPVGEMGRRIYVRWDLTCGPDDRDQVVALPEGARFTNRPFRE
jgi:hypothetical protein